MQKTKISATVVADSINQQGDRLTSLLITFPRIILAEVNTHRMLSKNTSSSRAIPFNKMVEAIQDDPFVPVAWQKQHSGMQGTEYFTAQKDIDRLNEHHLISRDMAVMCAKNQNNLGATKQICNRYLEPFMWTTMLITGSREGWDNFFHLRCPQYNIGEGKFYKSKKDALKDIQNRGIDTETAEMFAITDFDWLKANKGQAEIHMMALAECIWDSVNESVPKQLKAGAWHVPFIDKFEDYSTKKDGSDFAINDIKISVAMAARTSYTVVGEEKEINYENLIGLHDRLLTQDPSHSSPMEHCCQCVSQEEYDNSFKGKEKGWFRNYKGFKSYREIIEESK